MVSRDFTASQNLIADPRFVEPRGEGLPPVGRQPVRGAAGGQRNASAAGSGAGARDRTRDRAPGPTPATRAEPQPGPTPGPGTGRPSPGPLRAWTLRPWWRSPLPRAVPRSGARCGWRRPRKDDKRVARVDFYVDKKLVDRDTSAPFRETWRVRKLGYGPHTITAKAYDSAGQLDADAVSVRRVRGGGRGEVDKERQGGEAQGEAEPALAGPLRAWHGAAARATGRGASRHRRNCAHSDKTFQDLRRSVAALKGACVGPPMGPSQAT